MTLAVTVMLSFWLTQHCDITIITTIGKHESKSSISAADFIPSSLEDATSF